MRGWKHAFTAKGPQNRREERAEEGKGAESMDSTTINEKLAIFLKERPYFFDISHEQYKNRMIRDEKLVVL